MNETPPEVFAFPIEIALIPVVVAVLCLVLGAFCFRKREARPLSLLLFAIMLIAGGLFAPAMLQDRIVVTSQEIATTNGFWFSPTKEGFVFQDVGLVRITTHQDLKGRVGPAWEVHFKDGRVKQIPLSDLWSSNSEQIMSSLQRHGVLFSK